MKSIPLTQGKFALVDDEDFERLNQHKWHYTNRGYAKRHNKTGEYTPMQNDVMGVVGERTIVDHINRNKLDNRKENLRICTQAQNRANSVGGRGNPTGYKGVTKHPLSRKWRARLIVGGKIVYNEYFDNPKDAALAYDKAAKGHQGEFAYLNFPD